MSEKEKLSSEICCFFGHRRLADFVIPLLQEQVEKLILDCGVKQFYVGGCGDFDSYATTVVRRLKKKYSDIKIFLIPAYFYVIERDKIYIANHYDGTIFPDIENVPKRFAIVRRNYWMVEQCKYVISYVEFTWGGADHAVRYAKRKKRIVINLAS